jgi:hypothetical protein
MRTTLYEIYDIRNKSGWQRMFNKKKITYLLVLLLRWCIWVEQKYSDKEEKKHLKAIG